MNHITEKDTDKKGFREELQSDLDKFLKGEGGVILEVETIITKEGDNLRSFGGKTGQVLTSYLDVSKEEDMYTVIMSAHNAEFNSAIARSAVGSVHQSLCNMVGRHFSKLGEQGTETREDCLGGFLWECSTAEEKYKETTGRKAVPAPWSQAKSDIKRFVEAGGDPLEVTTSSAMRAWTKKRKDALLEEAEQKAKAAYAEKNKDKITTVDGGKKDVSESSLYEPEAVLFRKGMPLTEQDKLVRELVAKYLEVREADSRMLVDHLKSQVTKFNNLISTLAVQSAGSKKTA